MTSNYKIVQITCYMLQTDVHIIYSAGGKHFVVLNKCTKKLCQYSPYQLRLNTFFSGIFFSSIKLCSRCHGPMPRIIHHKHEHMEFRRLSTQIIHTRFYYRLYVTISNLYTWVYAINLSRLPMIPYDIIFLYTLAALAKWLGDFWRVYHTQ